MNEALSIPKLTRRQREVYDALVGFMERERRTPFLSELAKRVGGVTQSTICTHLKVLERKGLLTRNGRSISLAQLPGVISLETAAKAIASLTASSDWAVVELRRHGYHGLADEVVRVGSA